MYTIKVDKKSGIIEVDFCEGVDSNEATYDCINEVGKLFEKNNVKSLLINTKSLADFEKTLESFRVGLEIQFILLKRIFVAAILKKDILTNLTPGQFRGNRVMINTFSSRDNAIDWLISR